MSSSSDFRHSTTRKRVATRFTLPTQGLDNEFMQLFTNRSFNAQARLGIYLQFGRLLRLGVKQISCDNF